MADTATQQALGSAEKTAQWPRLRHAAAFNISLRNIGDEDMPFLMALYRSTREVELDRTPWAEAQKKAFIAMQFNAQHQHYQVHYPEALWMLIQQDTAPIGRLYLERCPEEHRIIDVALTPNSRGMGIGEAVLRDLMEEAAARQKPVSIHVEKENPAMSLYRRLGFKHRADKGVYDLLVWSPGR